MLDDPLDGSTGRSPVYDRDQVTAQIDEARVGLSLRRADEQLLFRDVRKTRLDFMIELADRLEVNIERLVGLFMIVVVVPCWSRKVCRSASLVISDGDGTLTCRINNVNAMAKTPSLNALIRSGPTLTRCELLRSFTDVSFTSSLVSISFIRHLLSPCTQLYLAASTLFGPRTPGPRSQ